MGHRLFAVDVFAAGNRLECAEGVPMVGSGDDHRIQPVKGTDFTKVIGDKVRGGARCRDDPLAGRCAPQGLALPPFHFPVVKIFDVTDRYNLNIRLGQELAKEMCPLQAETDEPERQSFTGGCPYSRRPAHQTGAECSSGGEKIPPRENRPIAVLFSPTISHGLTHKSGKTY